MYSYLQYVHKQINKWVNVVMTLLHTLTLSRFRLGYHLSFYLPPYKASFV